MAAKRCTLFGATWVLLAGLYLALCGQTSMDEIAAAAIVAILAATLGELLRRTSQRDMRFHRIGWLRLIGRTLWDIARDTAAVGVAFASPGLTDGRFARQRYGEPHSDAAARTGGQAILVLATSLAPRSFVIAVLPAHRELLIHRLLPDASEGR